MKMSIPLISVWLTTHNRVGLLGRAMDSVLNQTYPHVQLIVVDDGSSDSTQEFLTASRKLWSRPGRELLVEHNKKARGAPAARNQAIAIACGEFITGLDDDDAFLPNRLTLFLENFSDDVSGLSTCTIEIGSDYRLIGTQPLQQIDSVRIRRKNFVGNQVFTRTERLRDLGGFDETMPSWQDYELWLRLIDRFGPVLKLPKCTYLLDRTQEISRITNSQNAHGGYQAFMRKHGETMTEQQRYHQQVNDLYNRSVKISWLELKRLWSRETAQRLIALVLKVRWPRLYRAVIRFTIFFSRKRQPGDYCMGADT